MEYRPILFFARRKLLIVLYAFSIVLSVTLLYFITLHCRISQICRVTVDNRGRQYAEFTIACLIASVSGMWLSSNFKRIENTFLSEYNYLEMPTAVFTSLSAGICAVIEIHYNFDVDNMFWTEKWSLTAANSLALLTLHAGIAFTLT